MTALHATERLVLPAVIAAALIAIAAGLWRDDPSGMQSMAGITERVMVQNGRLITELNKRAGQDRAALTATQDRLRASESKLAGMEASLAATIKAPAVRTVEVSPVKRRGRRRRKQ